MPENNPTITPDQTLALTVSADWGHFRRIDTTSVKQTYRIIPRTTVAGLLAAITGKPRDSYYETFNQENSAVAITVNTETTVQNIPMLDLTTNNNALSAVNSIPARRIVSRASTLDDRQRTVYEVLKQPSYTIWVSISNTEFYNKLKSHLEAGTTEYTPVMGKSEYIASVDYHGEVTLHPDESTDYCDSAVPVDEASLEQGLNVERTPAYNKKREDGRGRKLVGFASLAYDEGGGAIPLKDDSQIHKVVANDISQYVRFF